MPGITIRATLNAGNFPQKIIIKSPPVIVIIFTRWRLLFIFCTASNKTLTFETCSLSQLKHWSEKLNCIFAYRIINNENWTIGLWRYWIFPYRGDAATNIAVWRLIARPPPPSKKKLTWSHLCKCMVCCSKASARCRATAHCSRSKISLITWRDVLSERALCG